MSGHYPYCVHGAYVGGCGADYLCGPCEWGEPATPEQLQEYEQSRARYLGLTSSEQIAALPDHVQRGG